MQIGEYVASAHNMQISHYLYITHLHIMCGCVKRSLKCILSPGAALFHNKVPISDLYSHMDGVKLLSSYCVDNNNYYNREEGS